MADAIDHKLNDDGDNVNPNVDLSSEVIEQLREVFGVFDTSGDGSIDCNELKSILECVQAREFDFKEVEKLIASVDDSNDGSI